MSRIKASPGLFTCQILDAVFVLQNKGDNIYLIRLRTKCESIFQYSCHIYLILCAKYLAQSKCSIFNHKSCVWVCVCVRVKERMRQLYIGRVVSISGIYDVCVDMRKLGG